MKLLDTKFAEVYSKFKLHFYQKVFNRFQEREASLTTVETFCMEIIQALGTPTVNEFASFVQISPPNAAYKVNNLIQKGYLKKVRSETDRREYHLVITPKYQDYYSISYSYLSTVMERIRERFSDEDAKKLELAEGYIFDNDGNVVLLDDVTGPGTGMIYKDGKLVPAE